MNEDTNYHFSVALSDICSPFQALRPPRRVPISESVADILVFKSPGAARTPWSSEGFEYLIEPMNMLASRRHEGECFVGPARTGKTAALLLGWMAHAVVNDPGDMLFIQMSQEKAREFSKTDIERALNSPKLEEMKGASSKDDNTHDKMFKHGMWLRIAWPTGSNVSGSTYRYGAITDYDRIKNRANVDGEGALWPLVLKRTTTFMSRGMGLVESSPGEDLTDPAWKPATPHEAPPTKESILSIYNRSDRRRWYWRCPHCSDTFEAKPGLSLFNLPPEEQLLNEIREMDVDKMADDFGQRIVCPGCSCMIFAGEKMRLNKEGRWISEAEIMGGTPSSPIAGYWLGGVAAAYQNWRSIVSRYFYGLRDYALNGSEETLKTTTNTDQAMPYMSMHLREAALVAKSPEERTEDIPRYIVPDWTRFVIAQVDVQGGTRPRFVVQVHAVGPHYEQQLVDRFTIFNSARPGMGDEFAPLDPAAYKEDWDIITEQVVRSTYRTSMPGREIKVLRTVIDTGGEDGVTDKALDYYRRMRKAGLQKRIVLYKGTGQKGAAEIRETAQGLAKDVPVFLCNSNLLADRVNASKQRETPGPGYYHFPKPKHPKKNPDGWITQAFYDELKAEVRNADGTWTQIRKRNETFDLCKMAYACLLTLGTDKKGFWDNPPDWALPLAANRELISKDERREMKADLPVEQVVETAQPARRMRRVAPSNYLR
jgi:phage terminase large subunit GpA-like protein